MAKRSSLRLTTAMVLLVAACGLDAIAQPATAVTDARDGREYSIVEIAGMSWFARNLAYEAPGSSCPNGTASECETTGRLYPWELAVRACPSGSHLATEDEWQLLELSLGMAREELERERLRGAGLGDMLKVGGVSKLEIPLAGWRRPDGSYREGNGNDRAAAVWSGTAVGGDQAWHRDLSSARSGIWRSPVRFSYSLSVRCVLTRSP